MVRSRQSSAISYDSVCKDMNSLLKAQGVEGNEWVKLYTKSEQGCLDNVPQIHAFSRWGVGGGVPESSCCQ